MKEKNKLPEGWKEVELSDLSEIITGGTPSTTKKEYWENGNIPWLPSGDLKNKSINKAHKFITKLGLKNSSAKIMPKNTVVIALTGATTGQTGILEIDASANQSVTGILPSDKYNSKYLFYFLQTIRGKIISQSYGGAQPHINQGYVKRIKIPLPFSNGTPDLKEQERIVSILEKVEELKQKGKKAEDLLDEYLKSVFYEMFYNKGFEEVKLGDICEINPKKSELEKIDRRSKVSFLEMSSVGEKGEIFKEDIKKLEEVIKGFTYFKKNDVLFAKITPCMENGKGTIARISNEIGFGSTEFHVLRPNKKITSEFIYFLLFLDSLRKMAKENMTGSAGQKRVPKSFLQTLKIPLPSISLQQKFSKIVEQVEKMKENVKKTNQNSEELFNSLMSKAFRGELIQDV